MIAERGFAAALAWLLAAGWAEENAVVVAFDKFGPLDDEQLDELARLAEERIQFEFGTAAANGGRLPLLEAHGRAYGRLRLAIAWTDGLEGAAAKEARNWQKNPTVLANEEHGAGLFRRGLKRNPVVALAASNLIGIDIDGEHGRALLRRLLPGGLPTTVAVVSGREDGGHHLYYRPPARAQPAKIEFSGNGLTLSRDGYLVLPPALHGETGRAYAFAEGCAPWERPITELPAAIEESLRSHNQDVDRAERGDDTSPVSEGRRHRHLLRLGAAMRRVGAGEPSILAALEAENMARCSPPKDDQHVRELAEDIVRRWPPGAAEK